MVHKSTIYLPGAGGVGALNGLTGTVNITSTGGTITVTEVGNDINLEAVGGGGAVSSVSNSDGSLTITPTTGAVVGSLNVGHANTFTATQIFNNAGFGGLTSPLAPVSINSGSSTGLMMTFDASSNYRNTLSNMFSGTVAANNYLQFGVSNATTTGQVTPLTLYGDNTLDSGYWRAPFKVVSPAGGLQFSNDTSGNYLGKITTTFFGGSPVQNTMQFSISDGTATGTVTPLTVYGDNTVGFGYVHAPLKIDSGNGDALIFTFDSAGDYPTKFTTNYVGGNTVSTYLALSINDATSTGSNEVMRFLANKNVGVGTTNPTSLFSVGSSSQFQVDTSGNIVELNGATTSFPSSNSAGVLTNNGSGTLTWTTPTVGTVTSVSGTTNRITSTGGSTPVIDISSTFEALLGKIASPLSQFAATTSAQLAGVISDETGTGALVFATSPTLTTAALGSSTATTQTPADNSTKLATTAYVDNAVLGQDFKQAVTVATTTALATYVYNNGSSGVGATITLIGTGAVAFDGTTLTLGMPVLVKNEISTNTPNNGIYTVTQAGAIGVVLILTRRSDFDQGTDIDSGDSVFVTSGTTQGTTTWAYNGATNPTIGTTNITFAQTAGQGSFTSGNGITITGTSIAINTAVTVDKTTAQALSNKDLTSGTNTFPTFNQNTAGNAATVTTISGLVNGDGTTITRTGSGTSGSPYILTAVGGGTGTVTSVGLSSNASYLTIASSPVTTSGTITANKTTGLTANQFVATPNGSTGAADLRAIVVADLPTSAQVGQLGCTINGGGSAITTGIVADIVVPYNCTITSWTLLADQSGSIVVDVWNQTYASYPPTVTQKITASLPPTISSAVKGQSSTLTGWTTALTAGTTLRFNVNSATTVQRVQLVLTVTKT